MIVNTMIFVIGLIAGCISLVTSQMPPGFSLPAITHVDRNWFAMSTDPIGSVVTKVHRERTGSRAVTYGLETSGPPTPFKIDPNTGVVTVNDTLKDKENRSYSLWVTAFDGSSIPQRTEVLATITDNTGSRPNVPRPPPFALPSYPTVPLPPKFTRTTHSTTKAAEPFIEEVTVPDITTTTTLKPTEKVENDPHEDKMVESDETKRNSSKIPVVETPIRNDVPLTVIPLVAIGGLVAIVAGVIIFVWKKNGGKKTKTEKDDMSKDSSGIVLQDSHALNMWDRPRAYSNRYESWDNNHLQLSEETTISKEEPRDEWEFPRHRIRIFNIVGEGAFGQVWRAQAIDIDGKKGEQTVAVKTLKENASEKEKTDLIQELTVMKNLGTHPNVVRLIGCCTEKEPTFVIMEFVSLGKLQQFLRDSRAERHYGNTHGGSQFLTSRDLTHFAFQVARGMDFLSSKGIIHRDLAARNVLITEERTCKVADFGFARDVAGTHVYERKSDGRLPIRWMAPESLYDDIFSVKSDIWSFGVLLWEIVTLGSTPYPGLSAGDVMRKVREGHRLEKPEHCRRELYNIMYYCWEAEPTSRPDFKEVVGMLERLLCTEMDYIELERFPDHSYYNVQHLDGEKL
ncbi:tyrosine kinase receptor Cad96Ca isoform X1 [Vanessa cardui]|uniref:tyrosine kinase receptor Cad96Ca isoform X1 n=1 Tax=Vanessa cardui TaxID=171605 RepID=UPI001F1348D1|nr:tyrosine kinase receptor Cad96Ca isoform X1 [Vanessa cardui]XP_046963628.1 tyrosine kinase receptor Cad96Ca isoform X1 [Vanessa cardui]XP_046963629.1 tyrosine kinase receptor Cad96Ca isoform X1 [Vanessa cardui]XP_046963630.1 tyrosine kinase receptor Cad96Ca isoform X1 [Vanessa cardui]